MNPLIFSGFFYLSTFLLKKVVEKFGGLIYIIYICSVETIKKLEIMNLEGKKVIVKKYGWEMVVEKVFFRKGYLMVQLENLKNDVGNPGSYLVTDIYLK